MRSCHLGGRHARGALIRFGCFLQETRVEGHRHVHVVVLGVADVNRERARLPVEDHGVQRRVVVDGPLGVLPTSHSLLPRLRVAQHVDHLLQVLGNLHLRRALVSRDRVRKTHVVGVELDDAVGVHDVVGVRVPVRSARSGHEHAVLRMIMRTQSHLPEGSDLEVQQLARLQVQQLVVVTRREGVLSQARHRVVDVLRVEEVAAHEHAAHAVHVRGLRHEVVHGERQVLVPAIRFTLLSPHMHTRRGNLRSVREGGVVRHENVVYVLAANDALTDVHLLLHDYRLVEVDHAGAVLVVNDNGVVFRLEDVVRAVRGGRELELLRHDVAELLLEHVQKELVEGSARTLGHSLELLHVLGENALLSGKAGQKALRSCPRSDRTTSFPRGCCRTESASSACSHPRKCGT